jgi:molybdopterin-binding protein
VFSVRAEDIVLAARETTQLSAQNDLPATVRKVATVTFGAAAGEVLVTLEAAAGQRLVAAVTPRAVERLGLAPGQAVRCVFKAHACRLIAAFGSA